MLPDPIIGPGHTTIPDWPERTLPGVLDALSRPDWTLDPRLDHSGDAALPDYKGTPFCSGAPVYTFGHQKWLPSIGRNAYYCSDTLVHPDHPQAVHFLGHFLRQAFVFNIWTDDPLEIAALRQAIAQNMSTQAYRDAAIRESAGRAKRFAPGAWRGWPEGHPCHGIDTHVLRA